MIQTIITSLKGGRFFCSMPIAYMPSRRRCRNWASYAIIGQCVCTTHARQLARQMDNFGRLKPFRHKAIRFP